MACKDCITGGLHEGTPRGIEETLHGLPCYVTSPSIIAANTTITEKPANQSLQTASNSATSGHIVVFTDAIGYKFNNTRLLADRYATRCNAKVYIPEFMDGHAMNISVFNSMDILTGHGAAAGDAAAGPGLLAKAGAFAHVVAGFVPFLWYTRQAVCEPRIRTWMGRFRDQIEQEQQQQQTPTSMNSPIIGAAGFCWGGKYAFLLSRANTTPNNDKTPRQSVLDCAFTAHPSNLVLPVDAEQVDTPISVVVGDKDPLLSLDKVTQMKSILLGEKKQNLGCEVAVLPGAAHGFALRARPGDDRAMAQGVEAENTAVEWFKKYLSSGRKI